MTLDQLPSGCEGTILDCHGDDELAQRLMEMGLMPGERVERVGAAPLGDPIEYRLHGTRLCLRRSEAARIEIEADAGS